MLNKLMCNAYGQHLDRTFEFHQGLTVLIGANEAGKSTIKNAIFDVFYGFSPANVHDHPYTSWHTGNVLLRGECNHGIVIRRLDERGAKGEWVNDHQKEKISNQTIPGFSTISRHGFKEIYNIDLYDLSRISEKTWQEVEGMWVSQSKYYHLRSSKSVDKAWKESIDSLWRPRKKTGVLIKQLEHDLHEMQKAKVVMDQGLKERETIAETIKNNLLVKTALEEKLSQYQTYKKWLDDHQEQDYRYQQYVRFSEMGDPLPVAFQGGKLSDYKKMMVERKMYEEELRNSRHRYENLMLTVKPLSKEDQAIYARKASIVSSYEESKKKLEDFQRHQVMFAEKQLQYEACQQEEQGSGNQWLPYVLLAGGLLATVAGLLLAQDLIGIVLGVSMLLGAFFLVSRRKTSTSGQREQLKRECDILAERMKEGKPTLVDEMSDITRIEGILTDNRSLQTQVMEAENQVNYYHDKVNTLTKKVREQEKTLKVLGKNDLGQGLIIADKLYEDSVAYHHALEQYRQLDDGLKEKLMHANDYIKAEMDQHQEAIERLAAINEEEERLRLQLEALPTFDEGEKLMASLSRMDLELKDAYRKLDQLVMLRELLSASDEAFKKVYHPVIMDRVSYYMGQFTKHKYHRFIRDEAGQLLVEIDGHFRLVDVSLSQGMRDLLYLSLKLAIIDALGDQSVPLVLDEVWVNLDHLHRQRFLEVLAGEAKNRQIIMMTCHPDWIDRNNKEFYYVDM